MQARSHARRLPGQHDALRHQRECNSGVLGRIRHPGGPGLEPSLSGLERFDLDKQPLNNAVLVNYLIYFHDLDNFAALDRMNHGDLKATIKQIISIAKAHLDDPFYAIWEVARAVPASPGS